jgi:hypothetical protein
MRSASDIWLQGLARRYRELEDTGRADGLLRAVFVAGGVALAGAVLLAFVQTFVVLLVAFALALVATVSLLVAILGMIWGDAGPPPAGATDEGRQPAAGSAR